MEIFVSVGGSAGHNPRKADIVTKDLNEEEAFLLVKIILKYYNDNAQMGEKLGEFIDKITIDKFRTDVLELANLKEVL